MLSIHLRGMNNSVVCFGDVSLRFFIFTSTADFSSTFNETLHFRSMRCKSKHHN